MMLYTRPDGSPLPWGKVRMERTADFLEGALPPWLTTTAATTTFGEDGVTIGTTAVNGDLAQLQTTFALPWSANRKSELEITVEGLVCNGDTNLDIGLGLANNTTKYGAVFSQASTGTTARFQHWPTTGAGALTATSVNYQMRGNNEAVRRRNLTFKIRSMSREMSVWEDDQPMVYLRPAQLSQGGLIIPSLYVVTRTAAVKSVSCRQFKIAFTTE